LVERRAQHWQRVAQFRGQHGAPTTETTSLLVPLDSATTNTALRALRRRLRTLLLMRYHSNELVLLQPRRRRRRRAHAVSWQLGGDDVACCVACYPSHARAAAAGDARV